MIDGLRPYPEMRPSGMDWLGDVPAGWDVHRAKYAFREVDDRSEQGDEELLSVSHKTGVTPRSQKNVTMFMAESYEGHKVCRPGDIVVNTMWAWMAALGVTPQTGIVSPAYGIYRPRSSAHFEPRFLDYLLRTEVYRAEYVRSSRGITTSRLRLYPPDFLNIPFIQPPLDEQWLIVRYLDWYGAQTAKLIRAKKRIIALLNEEKQAIIHRAVTRGLDPNAKLKPSGVPWLGDVPEGWEATRLRNLAETRVSNVDKKSFEDEHPVRLCNYSDVYKNDVIRADIPFMPATASQTEIERFRLRIDDVIITKDSEDWKDIGVPALSRTEADDLVCGYHLALLRPSAASTDGAFLFWQLLSPYVRRQFAIAANGVTRYGLSHGAIKEIVLLAPDLAEQRRIAAFLEAETAGLRGVEERIRREITLIQEFRTRLIADVVTGKLDVRAAAAALPKMVDLEMVEEPVEDDLDQAGETEDEEVAA